MTDTRALLPVPITPRGLAGRGMPRRVGPLLGAFARRFLDHIPFPAEMTERLLAWQRAGAVVVYVHRSRNPVEHLALARVVAREGLPAARYVGGLSVLATQPFWMLPLWLRDNVRSIGSRVQREEALLTRCVRAGLPAEIFLRKPLTLLTMEAQTRVRFIEVLVRLQRSMSRPIVLVPCFLALKQRPGNFEPTPLDAIFGTVEEPGLLRAIGRVIAAGETARFEVSEPIDLQAFVKQSEALADPVVAKKVRWSILHHLARVERVAHGPALKSQARMRSEVLRDPSLQREIEQLATSSAVPAAALEKKAGGLHDEIAARFDVDVARILSRLLDVIWRRIYDGVHFDPAEVERIRAAARRGPLVLVPSHRSHVDYLVMSQVMLKAGLLPPLVAAGDNLSFFPLGPLLRRGGAFFLRRAFKGDALYGAVFRAYVRKLFTEGFTQEFFIEGGRSRTGKTLPPKLGLLSMLVDAYLESREDDAIFLPCHISYERVLESGSYVGELGGKAKKKESAAGLVKSAGLLQGRYGRVYVTFDEPISLAEHLQSRAFARERAHDDQRGEARRLAVATLGHKIVYGINRCGVVTSTSIVAAAFFGLRRKGVDEDALLAVAQALVAHLDRKPPGSVRWQPGLRAEQPEDDATHVASQLRLALARLVDDALLVRLAAGARVLYQRAPDATFPLDTFKNQLLHHVVPEAIVATAFLAAQRRTGAKPGDSVPHAEVAEAARALSRVLKLEFIFRPGVAFDELFVEATREALASGLVLESDAGLMVPDAGEARVAHRVAASLIANFIEAYHASFVTLGSMAMKGPLPPDKLLASALLETLQARVLAGEVVCEEAASKAIVDNVVALARELGILHDGAVPVDKRRLLDDTIELLARARPAR